MMLSQMSYSAFMFVSLLLCILYIVHHFFREREAIFNHII